MDLGKGGGLRNPSTLFHIIITILFAMRQLQMNPPINILLNVTMLVLLYYSSNSIYFSATLSRHDEQQASAFLSLRRFSVGHLEFSNHRFKQTNAHFLGDGQRAGVNPARPRRFIN